MHDGQRTEAGRGGMGAVCVPPPAFCCHMALPATPSTALYSEVPLRLGQEEAKQSKAKQSKAKQREGSGEEGEAGRGELAGPSLASWLCACVALASVAAIHSLTVPPLVSGYYCLSCQFDCSCSTCITAPFFNKSVQ